jgi:pyruvate/2-oxoglutarate dehydrogenase complex dihydrolipoamide acyltransferase (E2) component
VAAAQRECSLLLGDVELQVAGLVAVYASATRLAADDAAAPGAAPVQAASPAAGAWAARPSAVPAKVDGSLRLSPVVRKLAAEHGIDPTQVPGTGRDGRVTREDMLAFVEARKSQAVAPALPASAPAAPAQAAPSTRPAAATPALPVAPVTAAPASTGPSERIRLNPIRKRTAEHLARAWVTVPAVLQAIEVDFHKVDEARKAAGSGWKAREGFSLTYLPFIARAV